jgi:hypothetical protein
MFESNISNLNMLIENKTSMIIIAIVRLFYAAACSMFTLAIGSCIFVMLIQLILKYVMRTDVCLYFVVSSKGMNLTRAELI